MPRSLFLLACLLAVVKSANVSLQFSTMGSQTAFPLFSEWTFAYQQFKPTFGLTYVSTGTAPAFAGVSTNAVDFAVTVSIASNSVLASSYPPNDSAFIPVCAAAYVFSYNLPYGGLAYGSTPQLNIVLDMPTTAKIFALQITNWRDPAILRLQTSAVAALLPNATITVAVRSDSTVVNTAIQQIMINNNPSWPWGVASTTWPAAYLNSTGVYAAYQTWGAIAASTSVSNAISYVPYSSILTDPGLVYATMINRNNDTVTVPQMGTAAQAANWTSMFDTTGLLDSASPGAWPVAFPIYVMFRIRNITSSSCDRQRELFLFFKWITTNDWAVARMVAMGFSSLGASTSQLQQRIQAALGSYGCPSGISGNYLDLIPLSQHNGGGFLAIVILTAILAAAVLGMVIFYLIRDRARLSFTANIFFLLLVLGALLNFTSIGPFYMIPSSDSVCQGRVWLVCLGFTIMLSAIFCRGYQIRAVQQLANSSNIGSGVRHTLIQVAGNAIVVAAQLILLLVWNLVDPFMSTKDSIDTLNLTFLYICSSRQPMIWWSLEVVFAMSLLMFGLHVVYRTWDLKHMVKESKWIAISVYNVIVTIALMLALFTTLAVQDDTVFWLGGLSTVFLTTLIMAALFLPRLLTMQNAADAVSDGSKGDQSDTKDATTKCRRVSNRPSVVAKANETPRSTVRSKLQYGETTTISKVDVSAGDYEMSRHMHPIGVEVSQYTAVEPNSPSSPAPSVMSASQAV